MRKSIEAFRAMKSRGEPIVMVTAYDFTSAEIADAAGLPVLLVGDSLGMVVYGHDSTLQVTLDDMIRHAAAVVRGSAQALVIADLPFLTYATLEQGVASAGRLIAEAGVQAVKLEGGSETVIATVRRLVELGIPVMGHLGYTPQSTLQIGIRLQAKSDEGAHRLIAEATALQEAGAFGLVLELVPDDVAARATQSLDIPVIGIGAGPHCDGQVQVWHDILGLYGEQPPRHAKRFASLREPIAAALATYAEEVGSRQFPAERNPPK